MERYEAYKDSGVEWIGEIPEGWQLTKTLFGLSMAITDGPHETPEFLSEGIPFVSAEAVSCGNGRIDFDHMRGFISEAYYEECCKKYIPALDDIYMIKSGASTGRVAIVDTERCFTIWSPLAVFRCDKKKLFPKYLFYYLQSEGYQKQVEDGWTFGTQQNVGMRTLERLLVCYPSLCEQQAIAGYLDTKTAEIDALVADCEREVELLREYRKAVISEAVTKGLDSDVPMKDSGVEWIGEIPEGWSIKRLSYCIGSIESGVSVNGATYPATENEIGVLKTSSVYHDVFTPIENKHVNLDELDRVKCPVLQDRLIVSRMNTPEWVGACGYVEKGYPNLFLPDRLWQIEIAGEALCKFVYYWLQSSGIKSWISVIAVGTSGSMKNIAQNEFGLLPIAMPPLVVQKAIVAHLDAKTTEIDSLIEAKQSMADKLREYRKSLISEAVTGKFKVPGV